MSAIESRLKKAEIAINPNRSGGVDQKILDQVLAIHDKLNQLKARFDRRKEFLWFKVFGTVPRPVEYDECLEEARKLTEQFGDFESYIDFKKANPTKLTPEKEQLFKQIFRD